MFATTAIVLVLSLMLLGALKDYRQTGHWFDKSTAVACLALIVVFMLYPK